MAARRSERRRLLGVRLALVALASALLAAVAIPDQRGSGDADLAVLLATGTLAHDNSRDGSAILTADGVRPGWTGQGAVAITNSGSAGSWLRLSQAAVEDLPGPAGGRLSNGLSLVIEDTTVAAFPVPVYSGALGGVGERWLGHLEPGEERSYRFRTDMPSGPGDDRYQASAVSVRFDWAVSDTDPLTRDPSVTDPPPADGDEVDVVPEGPPVVVVDRPGLKVKLAVPLAQRPLKRRALVALASCSRACRVTLRGQLRVVKRARSHRTRKARRPLSAGIQTRLKLKIRRRTLRAIRRSLGRGRSVRGRVRIVARDQAGHVARARQRVRLVPARRP